MIKEAPPTPPSVSSNMKKVHRDEPYLTSLFSVFRNRYFLIFTCTCGNARKRERGRERERGRGREEGKSGKERERDVRWHVPYKCLKYHHSYPLALAGVS